MNNESSSATAPKPEPRPSLLRNWISLIGMATVAASLFSFFLLFVLNSLAPSGNPYVGILTFLVAPAFLILGLILTGLGALLRHRQKIKASGLPPRLQIDLSRPRDRRVMAFFVGGTIVFLLLSAVGSYQTYHFTESVEFCGEACHSVMKPELVAYRQGPHARVSCTECHIGPGATWFVRSKLSGAYQVYAVLADKYPRPIPTPISNLRPAQETCEQCHWPKMFVGNVDRTYNYYLADQSNTLFSVRMLLKVGGADPTHGPVGGIHWHMNVANKIEYIATDHARQNIPWVRVTNPQGVVTEYRTRRFTNDPSEYVIRTMDCMDCHNRPAHVFESPNAAVNLAMSLGHIDPDIPFVKSNALHVLTQSYTNETQALEGIATTLSNAYPDHPKVRTVISAMQQIYKDNFFPEMKVDWKVYPNNIGHMIWPGCFRCHDGQHTSADGKLKIEANDCNACHVIMAQGGGEELKKLNADGLEFDHPGGELDPNPRCDECHDGTL